jgi:hypothetical protein
VNPTLTWNI